MDADCRHEDFAWTQHTNFDTGALHTKIEGFMRNALSLFAKESNTYIFTYMRDLVGRPIAEAFLSIESAADYLDVKPRTIYRYIKYGAPKMAKLALAARSGNLNHWSGYKIVDKRIIRPDGRIFVRRDLDHFEFWQDVADRKKSQE